MSPDPLGIVGGTRPNGYVENPNSYIDPLGLTAKIREGMLQQRVSVQKQARHIKGTAPHDKSYLNSIEDAQKILDATRRGEVQLISVDPVKNSLVVKYNEVTGTYVNRGNSVGLPDIIQDTNVFMIQGGNKIVPVNPRKGS